MKIRKIALSVFAAGVILAVPIESKAATQIGDSNLYYEIDNNTLTISGMGDTAAFDNPMEVPWYNDNTVIKNVVIEDTVEVTNMDFWFNGYENLISVQGIPDTVISMNGTFSACTSLETFEDFPSDLENAEGMFNGCDNLQKISNMPDTIKNCHGMFMNCKSLVSIHHIPASATDCQSMFLGCMNLSQCPEVIPASAVNVSTMFSNCNKLSGFIWIEGAPTYYENIFSSSTGINGTGLSIYYSSVCGETLANTIASIGPTDYVTIGECTDKIDFNIVYDLDGGTNDTSNPSSYHLYDDRIILKEPVKIGYDFVKWVCNSNDKNTIEKGEIGDLTFSAVFRKYKAPEIITDLTDLHLRLNDTMSLTPEVTGDHLQYKWYKSGSDTVISTEPSYTVHISSLANNGDTYYCVIYNDGNEPIQTAVSRVYVHDTPSKPIIETDLSIWRNNKLAIKAASFDSANLILQYSLDNAEWNNLSDDSLLWEEETSGTLIFFRFVSKYFDTLVSETETIVVKYDNTRPEITKLESNSEWTAEDSIVTVEANDDLSGVSEYYLFDNVSAETPRYKSTTGVFSIKESGSFFAAVKDLAGNIIRKIEAIVIRIDKDAPSTNITLKGTPDADVTLNLSWEDDKSGVKAFYWGTESDNNKRSFSKVGDFRNYMLTVKTPGTFFFAVEDNVGNISEKTYTLHEITLEGRKILVPDDYEFTLPKLSKKGYSLKDFSVNGSIVTDHFTVTDDAEIIPVWELNTYHINYNTNGGNTQEELKTAYTIEDSNFMLPVLTKDFSNFLGWRVKGTTDTPVLQFVVDTSICEDISLEAVFDEKCSAVYRVNYYLQNIDGYSYVLDTTKRFIGEVGETIEGIVLDYDGFKTPEVQEVILENGKETVIDYYYVRNRYQLTVKTTCNKETFSQNLYYRFGENVRIDVQDKRGYTTNCDNLVDGTINFSMPNHNTVIDINYEPIEYRIVYSIDSDVINDNPTCYSVESDDIVLRAPVREGYAFLGWIINDSAPLSQYVIKASMCEDIELSAAWEKLSPTSTVTPTITPEPTLTPMITETVTPTVIPLPTITEIETPTATPTATMIPTTTPDAPEEVSPDVPKTTITPVLSLATTPTSKPTSKPTFKPTATPTKKVTPKPTVIPSPKVITLVCNYTKTIGDKPFTLKISNPGKYKLLFFKNNSNVSVTSYGKVTLKKVGSSVITVVASNGDVIKVKITIKPKKNSIKSIKALGGGKIKVSFNKAKNTSGYQIRYSTSKNFTTNATKTIRVHNDSTSKTISKLKKNKKYYVSIRNYVIIGSRVYYSNWSNTKTVKTK